jgi:hypothetical protein
VISDVKGLFTNSYVEEVFSSEGLNAFISVEFWDLIIFYLYVFKTILFIYFLKRGYNLDQQKNKIFLEINRETP